MDYETLEVETDPPTSGWSRLTRHRPHQVIDLMLGRLLLVAVVSWVGSLSPLLAATIFVAVAGAYLASLPRRG